MEPLPNSQNLVSPKAKRASEIFDQFVLFLKTNNSNISGDEAMEVMKDIVYKVDRLKISKIMNPVPQFSGSVYVDGVHLNWMKEDIEVKRYLFARNKIIERAKIGEAYNHMIRSEKSGPSQGGFQFEDVIACSLSEIHFSRTRDAYFPLQPYIESKMTDPTTLSTLHMFLDNCDCENCKPDFERWNYIFNSSDREDFEMFVKHRMRGIIKPAGASQVVGPDIALWVKPDILMLIGSKASRVAYSYRNKKIHYELEGRQMPKEERKPDADLFVSHKEFMDNYYSTELSFIGRGSKQRTETESTGAKFGERIKTLLATGDHPLKLLIRVHSVLPYRVKTKGNMDGPYQMASGKDINFRESAFSYKAASESGQVLDKVHRYSELVVNLYGNDYLDCGLYDGNVASMIKSTYIDPVSGITSQ